MPLGKSAHSFMESLRQRDWLALHEAILEINSAESLAVLPARILAASGTLVPCDTATVQDDRGGLSEIPWWVVDGDAGHVQPDEGWRRGVRAMTPWEKDFSELREPFFACSGERHPHTAWYRETGDGTARRLSDVVPTSQLQRTRFFNEISRPTRINWQLTFYEPLPQDGTLMLAACRKRTNFSDRDLLLFDLLRPHVAGAWRRMIGREQLRGLREASAAALLKPDSAANRAALRTLGLTEREAEVLVWLSQGKTNPEISIILGMGLPTVKTHVLHIFARLGCETRTAAARVALETFAR